MLRFLESLSFNVQRSTQHDEGTIASKFLRGRCRGGVSIFKTAMHLVISNISQRFCEYFFQTDETEKWTVRVIWEITTVWSMDNSPFFFKLIVVQKKKTDLTKTKSLHVSSFATWFNKMVKTLFERAEIKFYKARRRSIKILRYLRQNSTRVYFTRRCNEFPSRQWHLNNFLISSQTFQLCPDTLVTGMTHSYALKRQLKEMDGGLVERGLPFVQRAGYPVETISSANKRTSISVTKLVPPSPVFRRFIPSPVHLWQAVETGFQWFH